MTQLEVPVQKSMIYVARDGYLSEIGVDGPVPDEAAVTTRWPTGMIVARVDKGNTHTYQTGYHDATKQEAYAFDPEAARTFNLKSVTHYLGKLPQPWMKPWVVSTAVDSLTEALATGVSRDDLVPHMKSALWSRSKMDYGTLAHEVVLNYATGKLGLAAVPDEFVEACELLDTWLNKNNCRAVAAENAVVWGTIGGTYDLLVQTQSGDVGVLDLKFTKDTYAEHMAQAAFYSRATSYCLGIMVKFFGILKFPTPTSTVGFLESVANTDIDRDMANALMGMLEAGAHVKQTVEDADSSFRAFCIERDAAALVERRSLDIDK